MAVAPTPWDVAGSGVTLARANRVSEAACVAQNVVEEARMLPALLQHALAVAFPTN